MRESIVQQNSHEETSPLPQEEEKEQGWDR